MQKIEFRKNEMINAVLEKYYQTFRLTNDTAEFVSDKYNDKISAYIFSNLKKVFNDIEIYYLIYLKKQGIKIGLWKRFKIWLSGLEPIYDLEQKQEKELLKKK